MELLEALDQGTWNYFQDVQTRRPILNWLMVRLGELSSLPVLIGIILLAAGWQLYRRQYRTAALLTGTFVASWLIAWLAQGALNRQRPQVFLRPLEPPRSSPSFPCDQTLLATTVFLSLACLAPSRWRKTLIGAAAILVLLIGVSRMYVGQSYVTDVFAGLLVGYALALVFRSLVDRESLPA
jgi:undecaprenyl-diphosphatase